MKSDYFSGIFFNIFQIENPILWFQFRDFNIFAFTIITHFPKPAPLPVCRQFKRNLIINTNITFPVELLIITIISRIPIDIRIILAAFYLSGCDFSLFFRTQSFQHHERRFIGRVLWNKFSVNCKVKDF